MSLIEIETDGKIRYTLPQRITRGGDVDVFFRVGTAARNVRINVYNGEKLVFSKKKARVAPGEMESITLSGRILEDVKVLKFRMEEQ